MKNLEAIEKRIYQYRNHNSIGDDQRRHLFYFYVGYRTRLVHGFKDTFMELLKNNADEYPSIKSYYEGYLKCHNDVLEEKRERS